MLKLNENERIDDLQCGGYRIISNSKLFCFGIDAVLLSHFANASDEELVVDFCTGNAVIPILMLAKNKGNNFVGIEIQKESYKLSKRNVLLNEAEDKIKIINGTLCDANKFFPKKSVDVITVNPPYVKKGAGLLNDVSEKTIARHEVFCTLEDIVKASSEILKVGGRLYMVHRPTRLVEIITTLNKYKLEAKRLQFVHPNREEKANLVLIEAISLAKSEVKVLEPIIIYEKGLEYTKQIKEIYNAN